MTIELSSDLERAIREKAAESGLDASDYVVKVLKEALGEDGAPGPSRRRKPISERFEEIRAQASDDVRKALDELPSDFAAEHDHYLYGAPKKYA